MKLRMDKTLKLWVEAEVEGVRLIHDPDANEKKLKRAVLQDFERVGYATRYVDKKGRIAWKATSEMMRYLRDCELEALDDLEDAF